MLALITKRPDLAPELAPILPALANGFPSAPAASSEPSGCGGPWCPADALTELAGVCARLNRDRGPKFIGDTSLDPRTPEGVLKHGAWKCAPRDVRRRHALALANGLGRPSLEVRTRAATALRHYTDQMRTVWQHLSRPWLARTTLLGSCPRCSAT
ncbi:MAG TPA: hypothetical protein VGE74_22250 [Gemmata sp.]